MVKKTLTKAEKAAATRLRKQELALSQLGISIKKPRKRRKPMTEEQRLASIERLKLARAARKPSKTSSLPEVFQDMEDDHPLHPTTVKEWIKEHKKELISMKSKKESADWKERLDYQVKEVYISNMESYVRTGIWLDWKWGEKAENKMYNVCYRMAYDENGNPKRNVGTWYADMREVYTKEMRDGELPNDSDGSLQDFFE
jgi:hypothetical protein